WNVADGKLIRSWDAHPDSLYALALSPDGKTLATGSYDQRIKLWDTATGKELRTLKGHNGAVFGLAFRPDGRVLASASADRAVKLWNPENGARLDTFPQPTKELYCVAFNPDGKSVVAAGADNRIRLWSVTDKALEGSNKLLYTRFGHEGSILKLAFSVDGKTLVSSAADKTVKLWNAAEITERSVLEKQSDWAPALAVTSSSQLIIGRLDGTLGYYDADSGATLAPGAKKSASVVPEGRKKIAQHFSAGIADDKSSPRGTKENRATNQSNDSVAPDGALSDSTSHPSDKSLGYSRPSLRDSKRPLIPAADRNGVFAQQKAKKKDTKAAAKAAADKKAAMAGKPVLTRFEPPGIQRGVATEVKLIGKNLGELTSLKFTNSKVKAEAVKVDPKRPDEALVKITADVSLPRIAVDATAVAAAGESTALKLYVDDVPQIYAAMPPKAGAPVKLALLPVGVWGFLKESGEHDEYEFTAKAGQQFVFDLEARRIGSKATTPALQLLDESGVTVASNFGMENNTDPLLAFRVPRDSRYIIRVSEVTLEGSTDHTYHLTLGMLPYVTGFFPLSASANRDVEVSLAGYNLPSPTVRVKTGAMGKTKIPLGDTLRARGTPELMVTEGAELVETEPNDSPAQAQMIPVPGSVNGRFLSQHDGASDVDLFAFKAKRGQQLVLETLSARAGSPADTKIEVLDAKGDPVPRMLMQAVRDSWVNFRRQDASQAGVRIANWQEMDLNDYVWFNGDIERIFRLPRGPDADVIFFSNGGKRRAWFDTTATQHALDDPCY
ncbi:MAG TPA: WD40 repeat domain-containing protein, partial [Verrucomicrobiae bacterium]